MGVFQRLGWFFEIGYPQAVFWIVCVNFISSTNDVLMRFLGTGLDAKEIVFFRFFFATVILLPIMLYQGRQAFVTSRPVLHIVRALLGFCAVTLWCYGVGHSPLNVVSTLALTVPLFVLPFAYFILKERVGLPRITATVVGFVGILVIALPSGAGFSMGALNFGVFLLIASAVLFALSDILNKVMVEHESMLAMLFYFSLGTSIVGIFPAIMVWQLPTLEELGLLFLLGLGGLSILFCLLKAYRAADVSALAPFRYLEIIFSTILGYFLFSEIPTTQAVFGAMIIIPVTFYLAYYDSRN